MSEVQNVQDVQEQQEREPFKISISKPMEFGAIASTMYITSNDLCALTNEVFRNVFADTEGSIFEVSNGIPSISILFNHGEYDEGARVAVQRISGNRGVDVVSRIRYRDNYVNNGDRYYLTEDGKDAFKELLDYRTYNNGNPNWKNIVAEYQEPSMAFQQSMPQYTKVMHIDLIKLCKMLFGHNIDGDEKDYNVNIGAMITQNNYMLLITRVSSNTIQSIYKKLGIASIYSSIIR